MIKMNEILGGISNDFQVFEQLEIQIRDISSLLKSSRQSYWVQSPLS